MFRLTRLARPRALATILLISAAIITLAMAGPQAAAAHPASHGVPQGPLEQAAVAERGDVAAEAVIDSLTRALSREHGYQPASFGVTLYTLPAAPEEGLAQRFADAYAQGGWATAPELSANSQTYEAQAWTSHSGKHAVVVGYGQDTTGGLFVAVIQAAR